MPQPLLKFDRDVTWQNAHQNVTARVERLYDAWNLWADRSAPVRKRWQPGLRALRAIVMEAEAAGRRVRAVGGGWSLSRAAVTEDYLINTRPLDHVEIGFRPASVDLRFSGRRERLVFAQGGASVMKLNRVLERRGLSLPTSGASNGQTLAGAVSTGTHGSAHRIGAMQDFILGLHVVGEGGRHYWIERSSRPVVSVAFARILGAELIRDTRLFNAAVVSFGGFGLIHALLFEAVPVFLLERHLKRYDYPKVASTLSTLDVSGLGLADGDTLPFHYEVVVNPYATGRGQRGAFVRSMYKRAFRSQPTAVAGGVTTTFGDDVMGLLGGFSDVAPNLVSALMGQVLAGELEEIEGVLGTHGQTFGPTTIRGQGMSTEIGVALEDAADAADAVIETAQRFPFAGLLALRFVKRSRATLAFSHHAPITCTLEVPALGSARTAEAYERIWDELERRRIRYTLHWGQCLRCDPARLRVAYGNRVGRWKNARRDFLTPAGRRTFANDLLATCGLAD